MIPLDLAKVIVSSRQRLRLTQAELAARASVSRRTLSAVETGQGTNDIGFRKLERILNALGYSFSITAQTTRPTESELTSIFRDDDDA